MRLVEVMVPVKERIPVVPPRGAAPYKLSWTLGAVSVAVAAVTFGVPGLLQGPAAMNGSARGTALIVLLVGVPALALGMILAGRGSARGVLLWAGALGYLLYNAVMFALATPFNRIFPGYVAMLSLAIWSTVALLASVDPAQMALRFRRLPIRPIAIYVWVIVGLNALVWLRGLVPAVAGHRPSGALDGLGVSTVPTWLQDLAFWLPLMAVAAIWLWQRRPWGYLLTAAGLTMWLMESVGVAVDQWFGHRADPASTVATAAAVWLFAALAVINLVPVITVYRALRPPS